MSLGPSEPVIPGSLLPVAGLGNSRHRKKELKTMYVMTIVGLMMAVLMAGLRRCSVCQRQGHTKTTCPEAEYDAQMNETTYDADLDSWLAERKMTVPRADGVTIYPEKMSLQPGKVSCLKGLVLVFIGRALALRKAGFHLPDGERWAVLPDAMVAVCDSGSGWTFSEAKGFVQGLVEWLRGGQNVLEAQATLSEENGFTYCTVRKGQKAPELWYGRPKRTGGRYVISGAKEDVE